jgi:hypothetical protein
MTNHSTCPGAPSTARPPWLPVLLAASLLGACATQPDYYRAGEYESPRLPPTQVYFYPAAGQTTEQQDRDRYECYVWAVKQTGFDPGQPQMASSVQVEVVPVPPSGEGALAGAFGGAIVGAAVSSHHHAGEGAVVGAILGAMLGAASDSARQEQVQRVRAHHDRRGAQHYSEVERRASDYRRAMAACLEGRGYTVH